MALAKLTPTHFAIQVIDDAIRNLKMQRTALVATLPVRNKKKKQGERTILNPLTGKKECY